MQDEKSGYAFGEKHRFYAAHTGGAVGASSVLLIYPRTSEEKSFESTQNTTTEKSYEKNLERPLPQGIVVAIICNLQNVGLMSLATDVARAFDKMQSTNQIKGRGRYPLRIAKP